MTGLPEYDEPPVAEVVCGVLFKPLKGLLAPHLGLLWEEFREEYASCRQVSPLAPTVERFGEEVQVEVELSDVPPLPRIWFVHGNQSRIIQVQQDRFLHNWRKADPDEDYPRYGAVIQMFRDRLGTFLSFLDDQSIGEFSPVQYEMTYVNEIPIGAGWESVGQIGKVFPDLSWRSSEDRFLSVPESVNCRFAFAMPEQVGRLHAALRTSERRDDGSKVLLLELTARGMPGGHGNTEMWEWYDLAHEWIVRSFADLTGEDIQSDVWRRRP